MQAIRGSGSISSKTVTRGAHGASAQQLVDEPELRGRCSVKVAGVACQNASSRQNAPADRLAPGGRRLA
jgi:hypothetical protein